MFSVKFYWRENVCDVTYFDYYSICKLNLMEIDVITYSIFFRDKLCHELPL